MSREVMHRFTCDVNQNDLLDVWIHNDLSMTIVTLSGEDMNGEVALSPEDAVKLRDILNGKLVQD